MLWLPALIVFLAIFISVLALGKQNDQTIYKRLEQMVKQGEVPDARSAELHRPLRERLFTPLTKKMAARISSTLPKERLQQLDAKLEQAGWSWNFSAGEWTALKWLSSIVTCVLFFLLAQTLQLQLLKVLLLPVLALVFIQLFFDWKLMQQITARKKKIIKELPDVLDLLTISVEAGLGFDGAMAKVTEKDNGYLAGEFRRSLKEMEIGMSRHDALKEMSQRLQIEVIKGLVNALLQADQLGLGMARVLRNQSKQVRLTQKQAAEETAMKAPVKMLFPLVFFIFPTIFIVLLGPAAIRIMKVFSGGVLP